MNNSNRISTDYIVYYRASTEKQRDGLGLDAQKQAISKFLQNYGGNIIDVVEEIVSGGSLDRKGFDKALRLAKETGATLLVHRIDRLSRSGFMTIALLEQEKVNFIEADAPNDSAFSKNIKFLVAKEEKEKIQSRVKGALAEINTKIAENGYHISKAGNKITSLGSPQNLTSFAREKSIASRREKALNNPNNRKAYSVIELMQGESLRKVASFLNENGFMTSTGKTFSPVQVSNLKKLYS
jgi:DNA invertase Pin-like site-specific DNA recombinase